MYDGTRPPSRPWRVIAAEVIRETDPTKLPKLFVDLCHGRARCWRPQMESQDRHPAHGSKTSCSNPSLHLLRICLTGRLLLKNRPLSSKNLLDGS